MFSLIYVPKSKNPSRFSGRLQKIHKLRKKPGGAAPRKERLKERDNCDKIKKKTVPKGR
jgi:hypothetical protein